MSAIRNRNLISVLDNSYVLHVSNIRDITKFIKSNLSIVCFGNNFEKNNEVLSLLNNKYVDKLAVISSTHSKEFYQNLVFYPKINKNIVKCLSNNILVVVNINNNYNYLKFVVKNLINLFSLSTNLNKYIYVPYDELSIVSCIIDNNNSIYLDDLINTFKTLLLQTQAKQYEFIYNIVCNYLDKTFSKNNLCDFNNNTCVANRKGRGEHKTMGCCYSFCYAGLLDFRLVKDMKLCEYMQNKSCSTQNISCKLFTCKYLKEQNFIFNTHKILLLDCFFNKKQHKIIQSNFFRSREEILNKLQQKNYDLYFWYYLFRKYRI